MLTWSTEHVKVNENDGVSTGDFELKYILKQILNNFNKTDENFDKLNEKIGINLKKIKNN